MSNEEMNTLRIGCVSLHASAILLCILIPIVHSLGRKHTSRGIISGWEPWVINIGLTGIWLVWFFEFLSAYTQ